MMGLVLVHSVLYLTIAQDEPDPVTVVFAYVLGYVGAAMFTTLVGISFVISMRSKAHLPQTTILMGAAIRGGFLIVVAVLLSILTEGPDAAFEGDVLVLIGLASIIIAALRPLPSWALMIIAVGVVALAPLARSWTGYAQWWGGAMLDVEGIPPAGIVVHPAADIAPGFDVGAALLTWTVVGWFPLLPWLAFPILGMVLGRAITSDRVRRGTMWTVGGSIVVATGLGLALFAFARSWRNPETDHVAVLSLTPNSTTMVIFQAGLVLTLMGVAHLALDRQRPGRVWMRPIRLVSQFSLTVYVGSYLVIFGIIRTADLVDPGSAHKYGLLTSGWSLLVGVTIVALTVPLLSLWKRHGGVGSLEWVMGQLRGRRRPHQPAELQTIQT